MVLGCALTTMAVDVANVAGQLSSRLADDTSITTLTVTGTIDASDFHFISNSLPDLTSLNLADATVVAYNGKAVLSGRTSYAANTIPAYALFGTKLTEVTLPASVTAIETAAFASSAVTSMTLPASVTTLGSDVWAGCTGLTGAVIPNTVTSMGTGCFAGCTDLQVSLFSGSVDSIPARTFAGCSSMQLATISAPSLRGIGSQAFANTPALSAISLPQTLTSIADKAFYGSGIKNLDMQRLSALDQIGDYAFAKCTRLTAVTFPSRSVELGEGVFFDDAALADVTLPSTITLIPDLTFKGASSITDASVLPSTVTRIGDYALMGWDNIASFTFPAALKSIGTGAMENWASLETLKGETLTDVPALGDDVWEGVEQQSVILSVNDALLDQFRSADQWQEFSIQGSTTDVIDNIADDAATSKVTYRVMGNTLAIQSTGEPIVATSIYDLTGRRHIHSQQRGLTVTIALDRLPQGVSVISVTLADSTTANIKITK